MTSILVIEHADACGVARVGGWLAERATSLDIRRGHAGDPVPTTLADAGADAVVLMGGPQDSWADSTAPWFAATRALASDAVRHDAPVLGICLGHQLLALALGGEVGRGPATQRGSRPITRTPQGRADPVLGVLPDDAAMLHWNTDLVLTPPPGSTLLATTDLGEGRVGVQAFRYGSALGLQGHPEVTPSIVEQWIGDDVAAGRLTGALGAELGATARLQDRHLAASGHAIIAAWLDATGLAPPSEAARTASAPTGIASKQ